MTQSPEDQTVELLDFVLFDWPKVEFHFKSVNKSIKVKETGVSVTSR